MRLGLGLLLAALAAPLMAQDAPVEVWAAPSVYKVRPGEAVQASNLVWNKKTKTVSVAGAKNEHVPFQLVVSTPPPPTRYGKAASGFFVEATDLTSAQGRIPRDRIRLFFEHVVLCYGKSSPVGETGFWPDALAPLTDPFSMAAQFREFVKNRGIWIDILVPENAASGDYGGKLRVTRDGKPVEEMNLKLHVYGFALPSETHLITYMGVSANQLAAFHGVPQSSPEVKSLLRTYHAFLCENRMEPWFNEALQPQVSAAGRARFDEAAYDLYLNRWKTKRVILEAAPAALAPSGGAYSEEAARRVRGYLEQTAAYFKQHGWLDRLVFNSPIDEPNTAQAYEDTRKWAALVHEAAPGVPFLVTESPVTDNPEWGVLTGYANNFAVHGNSLNSPAVKHAIRKEHSPRRRNHLVHFLRPGLSAAQLLAPAGGRVSRAAALSTPLVLAGKLSVAS